MKRTSAAISRAKVRLASASRRIKGKDCLKRGDYDDVSTLIRYAEVDEASARAYAAESRKRHCKPVASCGPRLAPPQLPDICRESWVLFCCGRILKLHKLLALWH